MYIYCMTNAYSDDTPRRVCRGKGSEGGIEEEVYREMGERWRREGGKCGVGRERDRREREEEVEHSIVFDVHVAT